VAVKGAFAVALGRAVDVGADLGHDGRTEGEVGDEVAVPVVRRREDRW
jgi:hypothetical protein